MFVGGTGVATCIAGVVHSTAVLVAHCKLTEGVLFSSRIISLRQCLGPGQIAINLRFMHVESSDFW